MHYTIHRLSKKMLAATLFILCLSISTALAAPRKRPNATKINQLSDQHMLGVDLGVGMPFGMLLESMIQNAVTKKGSNGNLKSRPNFVFGVTYGYCLPGGSKLQFAPEVGMQLCFSKNLEWNGHVFKESSLQIPLTANMRFNSPDANLVIRQYVGIGYELGVALSSSYTKCGGNKSNLIKALPKFSRFSGSIIINEKTVFQKGIFLSTRVRIPLHLLSIQADKAGDLAGGNVNEDGALIIRSLGTSFIELSLGLDIMELL